MALNVSAVNSQVSNLGADYGFKRYQQASATSFYSSFAGAYEKSRRNNNQSHVPNVSMWNYWDHFLTAGN